MVTAVGFIMMAIVVFLLLKGKITLAPIFVVIPVIAALILGFNLNEINKFIGDGLSSVLNTAALFAFAVMYFSFLNDVGMFDVIVKKVMKYLGNKVEIVLLMTVIVACISHLDGSGATTMLITIPTMLPICKKMKIRPVAMLLMAVAASGAMNMTPWCSSVLRLTSATGVDPQELWRFILPVQAFCIAMSFVLPFLVAKVERKNGAGMTDAEFAELKKTIDEPAKITVSNGVIIFDMVLTLVILGLMLAGVLKSNLGFMLAFAIALVVNYPNVKEQTAKIKQYGGTALNMVVIIFAIGVLVGIMKGTGMIDGMANACLALLPESMGSHLTFIISLLSVPLSMFLGSDTVYLVLAPVLATVITTVGGSMMALCASLLVGACLSAGICLIGPSPYLALGLAGVEMGDALKYCFKWIFGMSVLATLFAGILGIIPF